MEQTYLGYVYSTKTNKNINVLVPYHKFYNNKYKKLILCKKFFTVLDYRNEAVKGDLVLIQQYKNKFILKKIYYTIL